MKQRFAIALALVFALSLSSILRSSAKTVTSFRLAIIRTQYSDSGGMFDSLDALKLAGAELSKYYSLLSNGVLDLKVTVVQVVLPSTKAYYRSPCAAGDTRVPCPPPYAEEAIQRAAKAGVDFTTIDGVSILDPECGAYGHYDVYTGRIAVDRPGVKGNFEIAYDYECCARGSYAVRSSSPASHKPVVPARHLGLGKNRQSMYNNAMGTKNISLPRDLEEYIDAKVAAGEYSHASEVVRDGLRLLMRQEAEKLEWLREAIAEGVAASDRGDVIPSDRIVAEVKKLGRALMKARQARK
ncbi:MAG: type II toxin-antitoxin system ParD family antitoxin [Candidatus Eremiobacteraeota bacterium]|nr:type II toxin-antitoxin system ParD family antitoxin [Candidatus Eremiobacteraeota bacterium]MBV8366307.1 type II toxin-antitoxin system ParD family antitoxin [Candidatus Eremiobacteraeota bacterium]